MLGFHQEIIVSRRRLLAGRLLRLQVLCGQLHHVVVINVHSLGRLLLVLARAVVVALVVVQFVGFRARTLTSREAHVMRTLRRPHDASASGEIGKLECNKTTEKTFQNFDHAELETENKTKLFAQYLQ